MTESEILYAGDDTDAGDEEDNLEDEFSEEESWLTCWAGNCKHSLQWLLQLLYGNVSVYLHYIIVASMEIAIFQYSLLT